MSAGRVRVPQLADSVYKDECVYSYTTERHEDGVFVNLGSFQAVARQFRQLEASKSGCNVFLNIRAKLYKTVTAEQPSSMFIAGTDFRTDREYAVNVYPSDDLVSFPFDDSSELPDKDIIVQACEAIIAMDTTKKLSVAPFLAEEERGISRYAMELIQLDNGVKISPNPSDWKCEESGFQENLWLNLSTGYIGSGRQYFDGTGGTGAALKHYESTGGLYPLAVKLGTITPYGADVYSYSPDEDTMVIDPLLSKHLAHWGINMMNMTKTEKTMEELSMDKNLAFDLMSIQEEGKDLVPLSGPGYTGITNIGNSCYINSTMQVLLALPEFKGRFVDNAESILQNSDTSVPRDVNVQISKLATALYEDRDPATKHSTAVVEGEWEFMPDPKEIRPAMLRNIIGTGHIEFSSTRQQDAHEYIQHLLTAITRAEKSSGIDRTDKFGPLAKLFEFELEERVQCKQSGMVKYNTCSGENTLSLPIPAARAVNAKEVDSFVAELDSLDEPEKKKRKALAPKRIVPFEACIEEWLKSDLITGFVSPATGVRGEASKTTRLATFPPYLIVKLNRYVLGDDWTSVKVDCKVPVPESFDFAQTRGNGLQSDETELPEAGSSAMEVEPDAAIVQQCMGMGFTENGSKRAALAVDNSGVEAAMNWIFAHMEDPDFNDPIEAPSSKSEDVPSEAISMLGAMGFSVKHATKALKATMNDLERAADWLFSRMGSPELDDDDQAETPSWYTGSSEYELSAIISHIGTSTSNGHYVCHIKKNGTWAIFNDAKVAQSEHPPLEMGFVYLFKRRDYSGPV